MIGCGGGGGTFRKGPQCSSRKYPGEEERDKRELQCGNNALWQAGGLDGGCSRLHQPNKMSHGTKALGLYLAPNPHAGSTEVHVSTPAGRGARQAQGSLLSGAEP